MIFKKRNIDKSLQYEVNRFLEYKHLQEKEQGNISIISELLPSNLNEKIIIDMYGNFLRGIPFLKNLNQKFLSKLSIKVKEKTFAPADIIFSV